MTLKKEYKSLPNNDYIMSHSDFTIFNLIFKDGNVIAINDFDNSKRLPRMHDLAEFLISSTLLNYIGPMTNMKLPVIVKPDKEKFEIIIKSYMREFHLSNTDCILLGTIAEIVWLWTLCLAILKEDYAISDLTNAVQALEKRRLSNLIKNTASYFLK